MMKENSTRLNKYLSDAGVCSRREADRLIEKGAVTVDGKTAVVGMKVGLKSVVAVNGAEVSGKRRDVVLLFNKPAGVVCTTAKKEKDNIVDFISYPERIYPIGRLDKDSRGLILLTNIGELHHGILHGSGGHEKEYEVVVDKAFDESFLEKMEKGVYLSELDITTRPCIVKKISDIKFSIILKEGKNRQIRRMCSELGYEVRDLKRIRIMDFTLDGIKEGQYREATGKEIKSLLKGINRHS